VFVGVEVSQLVENVVILQGIQLEDAQWLLLTEHDFNIPVDGLDAHRLSQATSVFKGIELPWLPTAKHAQAVVNSLDLTVARAANK
jgi:hypothetical protein